MSFSHRVAFYDKNTDSIKYPDKQQCHAYMDRFGYPVESDYSSIDRTSRYIPLASTGIEDSEGNEIFEGHILDGNKLLYWCEERCGFRLTTQTSAYGRLWPSRNNGKVQSIITGHALTDPDLVPESFDVGEYFGMEEDNDS